MDVYKQVATKLDRMPNGFPETEDGLELKLLKKIFSDPQDAADWLLLERKPETASSIAKRTKKPEVDVQAMVDRLAKKGLINAVKLEGTWHFHVQPFVIGMYEKNYLFGLVDEEYSRLFEEYLPHFSMRYGGHEPAEVRVIPVGESVAGEKTIFVYDDARKIIEAGKAFRLMPCVCRHQKDSIGDPCHQDHPVELGCIGISYSDDVDTTYAPPMGRQATKEEALAHLEQAAKAGLVHQSYNVEANNHFICNCCSCCCGLIRGVKDFNAQYMLTRSNYLAWIDPDLCTACGTCKDERCQFDAITEEDLLYEVDPEICTGCGVCAISCDDGAISIKSRPETELNPPMKDLVEYAERRAEARER